MVVLMLKTLALLRRQLDGVRVCRLPDLPCDLRPALHVIVVLIALQRIGQPRVSLQIMRAIKRLENLAA